MKTKLSIIAAVVALSLGSPVIAADEKDDRATCEQVANLAATLQGARQEGVPLAYILDGLTQEMESWRKYILEIYSTPRFDSKKIRNEIIEETRTEYRIACELDRMK